MQSVPFHIAFLLTRNECVIVPGLGAFVVFSSDIERINREEILSPPENFLGFNPEIKHNDGLLANSIVKVNLLSFKEANLLIAQYVTSILHSLDIGKKVKIPGVGTLYLKDNKRLFQPDSTLSCNALYYGLTGFSLPYLKDLHQHSDIHSERKDRNVVLIPVNRKFITYFGSIAAAFVAMCIIPTPLNNSHHSPLNTQYASLIFLSTHKQPIEVKETDSTEPNIQLPIDSHSIQLEDSDFFLTQPKEIETPQPQVSHLQVTNPQKKNNLCYYIIIASLQDQTSAKKNLAKIQSASFKNAAILFSDGKYRIYTNYFEDETEAQKFIIHFRKDYPEYRDVWMLKQKKEEI